MNRGTDIYAGDINILWRQTDKYPQSSAVMFDTFTGTSEHFPGTYVRVRIPKKYGWKPKGDDWRIYGRVERIKYINDDIILFFAHPEGAGDILIDHVRRE